ncbi:N-formylglutamate amidohydrolase [Sphingobium boeckii]|uniref:Putative N-formylglutamate amidohydrolase n=1 Tax=Sphingobium boeckii TaxID=1082345 RepID=A0A7W9AK23_9SPHN|nr:N-formylglutamate amidohydrolase [Sphingobium boeckii]MBB5687128.1 putative N-formylglutamate amidohydrolase [Sphingobium boeckii]
MNPLHIPGDPASGLLIIADHASNVVPAGVDLGVPPAVMGQHMAVDVGTWDLAHRLAEKLDAPAVLATLSRLVVDLNREADAPGVVPLVSDGVEIAGNAALDADERGARIDLYWRPYHAEVARLIAHYSPAMLISLHSFTPQLTTDPHQARPWEIGVLYNRDDRAARLAIPLLGAAGVATGDNLPYSGKILNATMNAHAEAAGLPYLGLEVRQDLISDTAGISRWADIIAHIIGHTRNSLA